jgi:hypothetical protein
MTKVQVKYLLERPIEDKQLPVIDSLHSVYGLQMVRVIDGLDKLLVQYDASRLERSDVADILRRAGLPVVLETN